MRTLVLLALLCAGTALADRDDTIREYKVQVLRDLADEGVIEAFFYLSELSPDPQLEVGALSQQTIDLLTVSAQAGHPRSLRRLGFHLLGVEGERERGLTLVAVAALLGERYAPVDLRTAPLLLAVRRDEVEAAIDRAWQRLERGAMLDCAAWNCVAQDQLDAAGDSLAEARTRVALGATGRIDAAATLDRLVDLAPVASSFSDEAFDRYQRESELENRPRLAHNRQLESEREAATLAEGEQRAYLDRRAMRRSAADSYLAQQLAAELAVHRNAIERRLGEINARRDPVAALAFDDILAALVEDQP